MNKSKVIFRQLHLTIASRKQRPNFSLSLLSLVYFKAVRLSRASNCVHLVEVQPVKVNFCLSQFCGLSRYFCILSVDKTPVDNTPVDKTVT